MFYLTITAKRKNAKRHIANKNNDVDRLTEFAKFLNRDRYIIELYDGRWNRIATL